MTTTRTTSDLTGRTTIYSVGWNFAGMLPTDQPTTWVAFCDALQALRDEISTQADDAASDEDGTWAAEQLRSAASMLEDLTSEDVERDWRGGRIAFGTAGREFFLQAESVDIAQAIADGELSCFWADDVHGWALGDAQGGWVTDPRRVFAGMGA